MEHKAVVVLPLSRVDVTFCCEGGLQLMGLTDQRGIFFFNPLKASGVNWLHFANQV